MSTEQHFVETETPLSEVVEAQGHLIDSHIMERIFDTVVEFQGRFEVEQFRIGRTNSDPSQLRLKIEAPDHKQMALMLEARSEPEARTAARALAMFVRTVSSSLT